MSSPLDELGGKCPYMPFLGRGQMSEGAHIVSGLHVNPNWGRGHISYLGYMSIPIGGLLH